MEEHLGQYVALTDRAPGVGENEDKGGFASYTTGLAFALLLTGASFMVAQTAVRGPRDFVRRRLLCFSLFWHALDIIWVALLTLVYLMGAR